MKMLKEIARDYCRVKNYVYQRYGGIRSLPKLYPGYTVQNEMTESGLRAQLGLPSVYFYLAVFDALGDIKAQWARIKNEVQKQIGCHEGFTAEEKHYLRFAIKVEVCFECILLNRKPELPPAIQGQYEEVYANVDTGKLNRYLCRQVRKRVRKIHTEREDGFGIAKKAYRYGDHGIYISTKEKRRRVFIPLTDENVYTKQLFIRLWPEKNGLELRIPLEVTAKYHSDYSHDIGLSAGMYQMFTTDSGQIYGKELGSREDQSGEDREWRHRRGEQGAEKAFFCGAALY